MRKATTRTLPFTDTNRTLIPFPALDKDPENQLRSLREQIDAIDSELLGLMNRRLDVAKAVAAETGVTPELSTTGGTSDARFVKDHCPVVEFGLVGQSMHQVDEHVRIEHIHQLKSIYTRILRDYFG